MTDLFREVDEELRRERLQRLWEAYGVYILSAALAIVLAVAGWRAWEYWEAKRAAESGDRYVAALDLAHQGKHREAAQALEALAREGTRGYAALARFRAAYLLLDSAGYDEIRRRVESLASGGPWRFMAKEALGLAAWRAADTAAAERWFNELMGDPEAPADIRGRAELLLTLLASRGAAPAAAPGPAANNATQ